MDYADYVRKLRESAGGMQASARFHCHFTQRPGAHPDDVDDVDDMEAEIAREEGMAGFSVPGDMKRFYTAANGFELGWQEVRTDGRVVAGSARLPIINAIYEPEEEMGQPRSLLYERPRLFDWTGEEDQVYMRFTRIVAEPRLFYRAQSTGREHALSLTFPEYLERLLEARAMYPWQRFFVSDPEIRLDTAARQAFVQDLQRLFPETDASRFSTEGGQ